MEKYKDIIELPYEKSNARAHMTIHDRAAQFSPFAALTGYDEAIEETARLTDARVLLSEDETKELGEKLSFLQKNVHQLPFVRISYFVPDERKSGGQYRMTEGRVKKVRDFEKNVMLDTGEEIRFSDILYIEGAVFELMCEE